MSLQCRKCSSSCHLQGKEQSNAAVSLVVIVAARVAIAAAAAGVVAEIAIMLKYRWQ